MGMGLGLNISDGVEKSPSEDLFKGIVMTKTMRVVKVEVVHGRRDEEMMLDEFGILKGNNENVLPNTSSRRGVPAISPKAPEDNLHAPSPDVSTILSSTPKSFKIAQCKIQLAVRVVFKIDDNTRSEPPSPCSFGGDCTQRISGASSNDHTISRRHVSEGLLLHKPAQSTELAYLQQHRERRGVVYGDGDGDDHNEALGRALNGEVMMRMGRRQRRGRLGFVFGSPYAVAVSFSFFLFMVLEFVFD